MVGLTVQGRVWARRGGGWGVEHRYLGSGISKSSELLCQGPSNLWWCLAMLDVPSSGRIEVGTVGAGM